MNERERIIELVDRGIISTEEAIVLLEKSQNVESSGERTSKRKANTMEDKSTAEGFDSNTNQFFEKHSKQTFTEESENVADKIGSFFKGVYNSYATKQEDGSEKMRLHDEFSHEFYYPDATATTVDFKLANGHLTFETWDKPDLKVEAKIRLYGKMAADTPFEAFLERSQIKVSDECFLFHIPNKRIKVECVVYLPRTAYDHFSVITLNGDLKISGVTANDFYLKSTNGDKVIDGVTGKMLELEGVNGNNVLTNVDLTEFAAKLVNGNSDLTGSFQKVQVSKTNGEVRLQTNNEKLEAVDVKIKTGNATLILPHELGFDGIFKTNFGAVKSQLATLETVLDRKDKGGHQTQCHRVTSSDAADSELKVMIGTGNIYLNEF